MLRYFLIVLALAGVVAASQANAKGPKTVHVRGYTRKDGTYVRPHYRSKPSRGASSADVIARTAIPTPRTSARTAARKHYTTGSAGLVIGDGERGDEESDSSESPIQKRTAKNKTKPLVARSAVPTTFRVHLPNGSTIDAADVVEKDGRYVITLTRGGAMGLAKNQVASVERVEPLVRRDVVVSVDTNGTLNTEQGYHVALLGLEIKDLVGAARLREYAVNELVAFAYDSDDGSIDDHGRLRAFVRREKDQLDLNLEMIRIGGVSVDRSHPCSRTTEFLRAEQLVPAE